MDQALVQQLIRLKLTRPREERELRIVRRSAHTARRQPFLMVIASLLMATFVAMIPFTDASAIDPTWLTGIYDDADSTK